MTEYIPNREHLERRNANRARQRADAVRADLQDHLRALNAADRKHRKEALTDLVEAAMWYGVKHAETAAEAARTVLTGAAALAQIERPK